MSRAVFVAARDSATAGAILAGVPTAMNAGRRIWTALFAIAIGAALSIPGLPRADAAQAVLCGRPVSFDIQGSPDDRRFVGVWLGGQWTANICGALIVEHAAGGMADVIYVYGPSGPQSRMSWNSLHRTARIAGDELTFRDDQAGTFVFRLTGSVMAARFVDSRGRSLQTALQREQTKEPPAQASRPGAAPLEKVEEAPKPPVDAAESLIASAREEKKPELIKAYLLKNANAPDFTALMRAYVELSEHAKSRPFGVVQSLKIYDSANIEGKVLREDPVGKTYIVVRKEGDFTYVEYDLDKYGYIYHGFLE